MSTVCKQHLPHPASVGVCSGILLVISILFFSLTAAFVFIALKSQLSLTSVNSALFPVFQNPTQPLTGPEMNVKMNLYGFHCTNAVAVLKNGAKPILEQIGPFAYIVTRYKVPLTWNTDKTVVTYRYHTLFNFDRSSSVEADDERTYTFVNPGIAGAATRLDVPDYNDFVTHLFECWMTNGAIDDCPPDTDSTPNDNIFTERTMKEFVFGFHSKVLTKAKTLEEISQIPVPTTYVAIILNDSALTFEGDSKQKTGKRDFSNLLKVTEFAGYEKMVWWNSDYAQQYRGTDGTQFPLNLDVGDKTSAFLDIFFRPIDLEVELKKTKSGLNVNQLRIDPLSLQNADENKINIGYNHFGPSGVYNVSSVPLPPIYNAPIYLSKPMFLDADEIYSKQVVFNNSAPSSKKHDLYFDSVENLGILIGGHLRIQVNVKIWPAKCFSTTKNISEALVPAIWVDLEYIPSSGLIKMVKGKLSLRSIMLVLGYVAGSIFLILAITLAVITFYAYKYRIDDEARRSLIDVNNI